MEIVGWLVVAANRARYNRLEGRITRVLTKKPDTASNEVAIRIALDLPDTLFERPQLEARISVPGDSLGAPLIAADVQENIAAILTEQLGMRVRLSAGQPEEADDA
ncbi:MAG: hypothetical protein VW338_00175 [Rhodospirillaceae bacterium]